jgi:hypothetical protein
VSVRAFRVHENPKTDSKVLVTRLSPSQQQTSPSIVHHFPLTQLSTVMTLSSLWHSNALTL